MKGWCRAWLLGCIGVICLLTLSQTVSAQEKFTDLHKSEWAADSIYYLSDRGTVAGYGNGRFSPHVTVTRAQAITFIVRELYPDLNPLEEINYWDVPRTHMFYKEIAIATNKGLTGGFPDESFRPDSPISRAETTAILTRAYSLVEGNQSVALADVEGHWASESILLMASNGLIGGYPDRTFGPDQSVTRAEYAVFLTRVIQFQRAEAIQTQDWDKLLSLMTLGEKVGQMLMPDIRMWNGTTTTAVNEGISRPIREQHVGGLILFDKNIVDIEQLTSFTHHLQKQVGDIPLLLGVDQEGGVVKRIPGGTNLPGQMALGAGGKPERSLAAGQMMGDELKALGINVNFAPVLDINTNSDNPIIGIRSFGSSPDLVAMLGVASMQGLQKSGVIPAVKHFPGHGDTTVDSHLGLPVVPHDRQRLEEVELKPFRAAIRSGVEMIMTAHVAFPAVESGQIRSQKDGSMVPIPATLSKKVLTGMLRNDLGFEGVIISDAFTMNAISEHFGEDLAVKMAVSAGVDIILMPKDVAGAHQTLVNAIQKGEISKHHIDLSVKRILQLKQQYGLFQPGMSLQSKLKNADNIVGSDKHRILEKQIAEEAITLLKNENNILPYRMQEGDHIVIVAPSMEQAKLMERQLSLTEIKQRFTVESVILDSRNSVKAIQSLNKADFVILASYQFRSPINAHDWTGYQALIDQMNREYKGYTLLSLGNPYELLFLRDAKSGIAVYGAQEPNVLAGMKVIFGQLEAQGTLP